MKEEIYQLTYEQEEKYWWYLARRRIILTQLKIILSGFPKLARLLDVGCGTGINLLEFSKISDAYGLDASNEAIRFCKKRDLKNLALFDLTLPKNEVNPFRKPFQIITMLDMLEHIRADQEFVIKVARWLDKDGYLVITVPAYQWLWGGEDVVSYHVRRYSIPQIRGIIENAGLTVEKISYFNTLLFPFQVLVILLKKVFIPSSRDETNVEQIPDWLNSTLAGIFSLESGILKHVNLPYGGSILCICRKKTGS